MTGLLREHAATRGDQTAFVFLPDGESERGRLSFSELHRRSSAVAKELEQRGLRRERVVLLFASNLEFVVAFFGCLAAGVIAVPVCPPRRPEGCEHAFKIARAAGARLVLADGAVRANLSGRLSAAWRSELPLEVLSWLDDPREIAARVEGADPFTPRPEDTAFLQFTSGSTGDPKGVVVTHANIVANQRAIQQGFRHEDDTVVVSWLPCHHDMGLVGMVMQPVYLGRPCVLMPPEAVVQRPLRWLDVLSRYHGTTSGAPNFGYQRCLDGIGEADLDRRPDLDLRAWRVAFTGAEPIRAECLEGFAKKFARCGFDARAFYPCYGMAEATLMITGVEAGRSLRIEELDARALGAGRVADPEVASAGAAQPPAARLVSCGRTWGDDHVVIVDPASGEAVPEDTVGEIWVTGPSVTAGYWDRPDATAEHFGAQSPAFSGKRFLRTGDLGFFRGGELFIAGRLKDLVILQGRNYYPQDIESTSVSLHPAFRPQAAVFSDDDLRQTRVVLLQEVYPHLADKLDVDAAAQLVQRRVGAVHEIRLSEIVFTTSRLPVTTSGKIRRRACRDAWRAGLLKPVGRQVPPSGANYGNTG